MKENLNELKEDLTNLLEKNKLNIELFYTYMLAMTDTLEKEIPNLKKIKVSLKRNI